ncbi:GW dipeptide domain-containing protein [Secundilactobacillus yichangensis]|uniref:GW dipeptide domain-containing protein n=1 Tax=Secundilactobacillus yichangensis TaxID=2799580 RepID=UPI001941669D|nr:GW dipeptide domain-containing protein [Secundilactobacillus yichangensis]
MLKHKWLTGLLTVGLLAGGIGASSITAQAKSYAKVIKTSYPLVISSTYLNVTGKKALYNKPGTTKGAKVVKTTAQLKQYAASKRGMDSFMYLRTATTNRHSVYLKIATFDHKVQGWIYNGKTTDISVGYVRYKDAAHTVPAGGVTSFRTVTPSPLTKDEATGFYHLANPGTANDGTAKVYSTPFETGPFEVEINMPNKVSSADYANDVFVINAAETRTRQGDRWLSVQDLSNRRIAGVIRDGSLKKIAPVSAQDGVTVNYVERSTGQKVGSVIVPFGTTVGKTTMDFGYEFDTAPSQSTQYMNIPAGYIPAYSEDDGFGSQPGAQNVSKGSVVTYYVQKKTNSN